VSQIPCSCLCRSLTLGFLFLAGSGSLMLVFCFFTGFIGEYFDQPACSIGEHSGSQSSCPRARLVHGRIFRPTRLFNLRALGESELLSMGEEDPRGCWYPSRPYWTGRTSNELGSSWSQWVWHFWRPQKNITSKVSDPPFTNLTQRSDSDKKLMLVGCLSGGGDAN